VSVLRDVSRTRGKEKKYCSGGGGGGGGGDVSELFKI